MSPTCSWPTRPPSCSPNLVAETVRRTTNRVVLDPGQTDARPGADRDRRSCSASAMTPRPGRSMVTYDGSLSTAGGNRVETRRFTASAPGGRNGRDRRPRAQPRCQPGRARSRASGSAAELSGERLSLTCSKTSFDRPGVATIRSSAWRITPRARLEPPPAAERRNQPRRDLRVELVGGDDHVGEERIAAAVGRMERPVIAAERAASERSRLGLVIVKSGCCDSFSTWSTVSRRCAAACSANHLSSTSGSSWNRS